MKTQAKRILFIDMVRGIAIVSVAVYHIIAPGMIRTFFGGLVCMMFFSFFFYSGYFHKPGSVRFKIYAAARAKLLLVPFLLYSAIFWLIGSVILVLKGAETIREALCCLRNFYAGMIWNTAIQDLFGWEYHHLGKNYPFLAGFWFLPAMFLSCLLFYALAEIFRKSLLIKITAIALMLLITGVLRGFSVSLPYNLQLIPFWSAILLSGTVCKELGVYDRLKGVPAWLFGTLAAIFGISFSVYFGYGTKLFRGEFDAPEVISMLLIFGLGLIGSWGISMICKQIEDAGIRMNGLAYLGKQSIYIYIFHVFIAWLICLITGFSMRYDPETVTAAVIAKSILLAIVSIAVSVLIGMLSARLQKRRD